MMRVVVALDKFKGSLSALAACEAVARGIRSALPEAVIDLLPMADGGEGTAEILLRVCGGEWEEAQVTGPLAHQQLDAGFALLAGRTVVELAAASGLELLRPDQFDPLRTTTYGTGQLLMRAAERGCPVQIAAGGSATVDGGVGLAMACGWRFLDERERSVGLGGGELTRIRTLVPPSMRFPVPVEVLCDVTNPLLGPDGAARTFGPQKGASPAAVERLEAGLAHLADLIQSQMGRDVRNLPGGGAAGGVGAGAAAFFGASLKRGADEVIAATGLAERLAGADWVIAGEGCFDAQTLRGKAPHRVLELARAAGTPVAVLAGRFALRDEDRLQAGIAAASALVSGEEDAAAAMANAAELLEDRARELALTRFAAPDRL